MPLEKELLVASVVPVCFQWSSSGLPVVFQCVPIIQINTGSPLGHHWVLASASVVPVASQCTCGSSGLPVWSVQWYPSVLTESGLEVIESGHSPACNPLCIQLVWWELFELNCNHLTCNPQINNNYDGAHIKVMHRVMLKYSHDLRAKLVSIDQSHRYGRHQAACSGPAGSYDKTSRTAICFEHKTQYLLTRAPWNRIVFFWHISNIPPMILQSRISCNTPKFYIVAIFVKYCYTTSSWLL